MLLEYFLHIFVVKWLFKKTKIARKRGRGSKAEFYIIGPSGRVDKNHVHFRCLVPSGPADQLAVEVDPPTRRLHDLPVPRLDDVIGGDSN